MQDHTCELPLMVQDSSFLAMLDRYFYQFTKAKDVAEIVPTCQ